MYKNSLFFLYHIRDACALLIETMPETIEELKTNKMYFLGVVKNLEIIGEATKNIPADLKYQWRTIEWKKMAGMRDRLTHEYWGISYEVVFGTVKDIIPMLLCQINKVIEIEEQNKK